MDVHDRVEDVAMSKLLPVTETPPNSITEDAAALNS